MRQRPELGRLNAAIWLFEQMSDKAEREAAIEYLKARFLGDVQQTSAVGFQVSQSALEGE